MEDKTGGRHYFELENVNLITIFMKDIKLFYEKNLLKLNMDVLKVTVFLNNFLNIFQSNANAESIKVTWCILGPL